MPRVTAEALPPNFRAPPHSLQTRRQSHDGEYPSVFVGGAEAGPSRQEVPEPCRVSSEHCGLVRYCCSWCQARGVWSLHARVLPKTAGNTLCVGSQSRLGGLCASFPGHSEVRNRSISHAQTGSYDEGGQVIADCGANATAQFHDGSSSAAQKVVQHMRKLLEHSPGSYRFTVATHHGEPETRSVEVICDMKVTVKSSRTHSFARDPFGLAEVRQVRLKRTTVGPLLEEEVRWSWCRCHNQTQRNT